MAATSINDLPTEILELVYASLDAPALYAISHLNRRLNHTALTHFFQRAKLYEDAILKAGVLTLTPIRPSTSPDAPISRKIILAAIQLASFIETIHTYNVGLRPHVRDAFVDLGAITRIIKTKKRCTNLELSFTALSNAFGQSRLQNAIENPRINVEKWRDALLGLVEEALKTGCRDLRIIDGVGLTRKYCGPMGNPIPDLEVLERSNAAPPSVSPLFQGFTMPMFSPRQAIIQPWPLTNVSQTQLTSCTFSREFFLQPPFRTWTVHALSHSPRLTSLTFTCQTLYPPQWSVLLRSICCPSLSELRFKAVNIAYKDLSAFLRRHSTTLRILELLPGLGRYAAGFDLEVESEWASRPRISGRNLPIPTNDEFIAPMPMLEEFSTVPVYLVWLMNEQLSPTSTTTFLDNLYSRFIARPISASSTSKEGSQSRSLSARFPRLREVNLHADALLRIIGRNFAFIERAFHVLGLYVQSFKNTGSQSPLKTLVISSFSYPDSLQPFFKRHGVDGSGRSDPPFAVEHIPTASQVTDTKPPSITSPLIGIRTIRIGIPKYQEFMKDLLAFVKGFPDVEILEIVGPPTLGLKKLQSMCGGMIVGESKWVTGKLQGGTVLHSF